VAINAAHAFGFHVVAWQDAISKTQDILSPFGTSVFIIRSRWVAITACTIRRNTSEFKFTVPKVFQVEAMGSTGAARRLAKVREI